MTADRARAAEAAAEQREEEDLLGFAASLDYDAYLDDLDDAELKSALQVRSIPQHLSVAVIEVDRFLVNSRSGAIKS